jgi:para-nitrobenzyl esterase
MTSVRVLAVAALLAALCSVSKPSAEAQTASCIGKVDVAGATVCGKLGTSPDPKIAIFTYQGIRYATAERWKMPKPAPWPSASVAQYTDFGPICPQNKPPQPDSEDCLFLNVWAPASALTSATKLPVMVFIHGGAYVIGSGSSPFYDGSALAAQGVVVVTLNYRLGALGFLRAAGGKFDPATIEGNFGLHDQQEAMKWVHDNIAPFGGDATRITLFGESAGAMSVGLHTFDVPSSQALFANAIMESNPAAVIYRTPGEAAARGDKFLKKLCAVYDGALPPKEKCPADKHWLSKVSLAQILEAQSGTNKDPKGIRTNEGAELDAVLNFHVDYQALPWQPYVDGTFVVGQPYAGYAPQMTTYKPLAFGVNANEGDVFIAMAYAKLKKYFTPAAYKAVLLLKFGPLKYAQILSNPRYNPKKQPTPSPAFFNAQASALANLVTDYGFACGTLSMVNAAMKTAPSVPVFGYRFTQSPFFDFYNLSKPVPVPGQGEDNGACEPTTGNVCHGDELPYAFNTLASVSRPMQPGEKPVYAPTSGDHYIADRMTEAWAQFATDPTSPSSWQRYDDKHEVVLWNATDAKHVDLDAFSSCSALWLKAKPYG